MTQDLSLLHISGQQVLLWIKLNDSTFIYNVAWRVYIKMTRRYETSIFFTEPQPARETRFTIESN